MARIEVLDLDNVGSLSQLSYEDINIVRGGYAATLAASKSHLLAQAAYHATFIKTKSKWLARAASLSPLD